MHRREIALVFLFSLASCVISASATAIYYQWKSFYKSSKMYQEGYIECVQDYEEMGQ